MEERFKIGEIVEVKGVIWQSTERGLTKNLPARFVIKSIKGISPDHTNIHKYELFHPNTTYFTNNVNDEMKKVVDLFQN